MKYFDLMLEQQLADKSASQNPWALLCAEVLSAAQTPLWRSTCSLQLVYLRGAFSFHFLFQGFSEEGPCHTLGPTEVLNLTTTDRSPAPIFRTLIETSLSNKCLLDQHTMRIPEGIYYRVLIFPSDKLSGMDHRKGIKQLLVSCCCCFFFFF